MNRENEKMLIVLVTVPNREVARELSSLVLNKRLAACVNIISNLTSIYHWQGKVEESDELLLVIKTLEGKYAELEKTVIASHPYDTAEVVALQAEKVCQKYFDWVKTEAS